jgi:hypothetical protein
MRRHSIDFRINIEPTYHSIIDDYLANYKEAFTRRQEVDNLRDVCITTLKIELYEKKQELIEQGFQALKVPSFKKALLDRPKKIVWSTKEIWDITHYELYLQMRKMQEFNDDRLRMDQTYIN